MTAQQGRGISRLQLQNLEKMHATRSFTFEEEEEWMVVAGRQDSKYQKFLSKRYVCVSVCVWGMNLHVFMVHAGATSSSSNMSVWCSTLS